MPKLLYDVYSGLACFLFCCLQVTLAERLSAENVSPYDGDLKLIDGPMPTMGTVLIYRNQSWGRICDDHWTMVEAQVVCRQLGLGRPLEAHRRNHFGSRIQATYLMDEVQCTGREERLADCRFSGWGEHDCKQNEEVGVKCVQEAPVNLKTLWNPLQLDLNRSELERLASTSISLVTRRRAADEDGGMQSSTGKIASFYPVLIKFPDGSMGTVCPDYFHAAEAIVFCKEIGAGIGGRVIPMPRHHTGVNGNYSSAVIGHCYGNETSVVQCRTYADPLGVSCKSNLAAAVECVYKLPDLVPELHSLETSSYVQRMSLWLLECALEENCLPDTVYRIIEKNPDTYAWMTRTLLRFSSIIENIGTEVFRPLEEPDNWEWHTCHMHYHSMKVFSRYEVIDLDKRIMSVGMKAGFCLEDNVCQPGITPKFKCSDVIGSKGTQGISPGCRDTYLHDYDCQWVDITDVAPGMYILQVSYNPDFLVPESNFFNNALSCELHHQEHHTVVRECRPMHPNDLY